MNSPRKRSTQNESDSVSETRAPASRARTPAFWNAALAVGPVPHVALEIDELRAAYEILVDVGRRQIGAGAEIGVQRPLAVRRHIDEAAAGRRAVACGCRVEGDALRADVGDEALAERIALHLADIGGADPERGDADDRVGGRSARDHARIDARRIELLGAILVDQGHRALRHLLRLQVGVVRMGEKVDQRVAQTQNLDAPSAHALSPSGNARRPLAEGKAQVNSRPSDSITARTAPRAGRRPSFREQIRGKEKEVSEA